MGTYRTMHGEYGYFTRTNLNDILTCARNVATAYRTSVVIEYRADGIADAPWVRALIMEPDGRAVMHPDMRHEEPLFCAE